MKRAALLVSLMGAVAWAHAPAAPHKPAHAVPVAGGVPDAAMDMSHAVQAKALASSPSSAQQLQSLSGELKKGAPALDDARRKSEGLAAQTADLRHKLVDTASRIERLERQAIDDGEQLTRLEAEDARLSAGFANDRVAVTRLLAVLERLQHDTPPPLAMRPGDILTTARGTMLIGASLPPIYAQAAAVARRLQALKTTRAQLEAQRKDAADTAQSLTQAHGELDRLLALKQTQAVSAAQNYDALKTRMANIARKATDLQALLSRVEALRRGASPNQPDVVTVTASNGTTLGLGRNTLLEPVVGTLVSGTDRAGPGLSYVTKARAQVITPADAKVLFAGPYHKSGQVLILEITTGYDAVLAGLDRVSVKPGDQLLAGEPVGTMPDTQGSRLYFEVRHGGHGQSPMPWIRINPRPAGKTNKT